MHERHTWRAFIKAFAFAFSCVVWGSGYSIAQGSPSTQGASSKPNILFILADDLGYGDVACYNPEAKAPTPHLDALARQGMRFTDAHSPSTVCTPTRYSLLTGRMAFRTGKGGVFTGVGGPCLIEASRPTLGSMLQEQGYATALFGKWHIGMTFYDQDGKPINQGGMKGVKRIDYTRAATGTPIQRGFDQFYGTVSCPTTDSLYAYVEGDRIPVPPTGLLDKTNLPKHPYANDNRRGMIAPDFNLEEVDLVFLKKSQAFLRSHARQHPNQPFFLFHSMQAVHLPSFPADRFKGKTQAGPHGDFIFEMDWIVGELMKTLDELGLAENTLVMFGSDNGPEVPTVIAMRRDHQHDGARPWRGVKRDQWEGGHRTPFIVRWPGKVKAGTVCDEPLSLTDVFATCAAIVGAALPHDAAEDSFNMLPVLLGTQGKQPVRPYLLQQTWSLKMSLRQGDWKLLDHKGSGGNNYERTGEWGMKQYALPDTDPHAPGQLYNLGSDPGETTNLYSKHPQIVAELKALLEEAKTSGRSAPAAETLRVLSYNIHMWEPGVKALTEVIRAANPDIVGLNEAWTEKHNQELARALGYHIVGGGQGMPHGSPAQAHWINDYYMPQILLTKHKIIHARFFNAMAAKEDPAKPDVHPQVPVYRGGTLALLETAKGTRLLVFVLHLHPWGGASNERMTEMRLNEIKGILSQVKAYADLPILIIGDFNTQSHLDGIQGFKVSRYMEAQGYQDLYRTVYPDANTFPGRTSRRSRIDYIFYNQHVTPVDCQVLEDGVFGSRGFGHSDHLAVFGIVKVGAARELSTE